MVSIRFITLLSAFAAAVSAAPAPVIDDSDAALSDAGLNITETADRDLRNGEMIVFGNNGRSEYTSRRLDISMSIRAVLTSNHLCSCHHY